MGILVFKWIIAIVISFFLGKIVSKFKLPSLLGWLVGGMILGPFGLELIDSTLVSNHWYETIMKVLECSVGFMIGTELVFKKLKRSGRSLVITTIFQSVGTYVFVSIVFIIIFKIIGVPVYLGFVFGGIALATAPAPALSIVQEFKTKGPVTDTLIPMAALDDVVGVIFFFSTMAVVAMSFSGGSMSISIVPLMIILPLLIGALTGFPAGLLLRRFKSRSQVLIILIATVLITSVIGFWCNKLLTSPVLNFMLMGMSFSAVFSNMVKEEDLHVIVGYFQPVLFISLIVVIINLGVPLNYKSILGAGLFTAVYILSRALGKYFGARTGAKISKMPQTVQKYLGFTLLPHSGVSLVFTGIAVSTISKFDPQSAVIIQGTIAAAAILNEIIAVVIAKKAFEWAGEMEVVKADK